MKIYFETIVRLPRLMENGEEKVTKEKYFVSAVSVADAEHIVCKELTEQCATDFEVLSVKKVTVDDLWEKKNDDEMYFFVRTSFTTLDERTAKERYEKRILVIPASSPELAVKYFREDLMQDAEVHSVSDAKIVEVL